MSQYLEELCHIDKGTYTDGPVLTKPIRDMLSRVAVLEQLLYEALQWNWLDDDFPGELYYEIIAVLECKQS